MGVAALQPLLGSCHPWRGESGGGMFASKRADCGVPQGGREGAAGARWGSGNLPYPACRVRGAEKQRRRTRQRNA